MTWDNFLTNFTSNALADIAILGIAALAGWIGGRYFSKKKSGQIRFGKYVVSPDKTHIAIETPNDIFVMDAGGEPKNISRHSAKDIDPRWSPDSKLFAFISDRDENWEVYVANPITGRVVQITFSPEDEYIIEWTKSGDLWIGIGDGEDRSLQVFRKDEIEELLK